jgi:hypothetical protein
MKGEALDVPGGTQGQAPYFPGPGGLSPGGQPRSAPRLAPHGSSGPEHLSPATVAGAPAQVMTNRRRLPKASSVPQSTFVPASAPQPGLVAARVGEDGEPAVAGQVGARDQPLAACWPGRSGKGEHNPNLNLRTHRNGSSERTPELSGTLNQPSRFGVPGGSPQDHLQGLLTLRDDLGQSARVTCRPFWPLARRIGLTPSCWARLGHANRGRQRSSGIRS